MSKTIQQGLIILIILVLISVGFAVFAIMQKMDLEKQNQTLKSEVAQYEAKSRDLGKQVKDLERQAQTLRDDINRKGKEAETYQQRAEDAQKEFTRISSELDRIRRDREDTDSRMKDLRKERDELTKQLVELKNKPPVEKIVEKIVYRDKPAEAAPAENAGYSSTDVAAVPVARPVTHEAPIVVENKANEEYWAGVMRQKAALELELNKVKQDLGQTQLKVVELTKANSDFEQELARLKNEKDEIIRKIKYGEDLADNLSIELARARNDQKMALDRASQVDGDNQSLRQEIKQLTTTKMALEKSIARLTDEKSGVEKKLVETENIIQSRIDEIWRIKKDIDTRFDARGIKVSANEVELPPIVVNAGNEKSKAAAAAPAVKKSGTLVSVNEDNNFVIIDMGEKAGIKLGDAFKVYRNGTYVGAVEVIQVRQDISAADIKQKNAPFRPGDTVK
ncbi:MAG: hypothetical protein HGA80_06485 [Candidatus Omnitrophica bacterium]|nr:hypothetical protein [Candidatus Omnitrophota bacterium]